MRKRLGWSAGAAVLAAAGLVVAGGIAAVPAAAAPFAAPAAAAVDLAPEVLTAMQRDLGLDAAQARERIVTETAALGTADRLETELGPDFAGSWLVDGELVVATTEQAEVAGIEVAGARAELVERSAAELEATRAALDDAGETAPDAVTSWYVDPAENTVVITATEPAAAEEFAAAAGVGDAVRIDPVTSRIQQDQGGLAAGEIIDGDDFFSCSSGFVATNGFDRFLLTSGHCTLNATSWRMSDGTSIGPSFATNYPGTDFGAILIDNPQLVTSNSVFRQFPITGVGVAVPGAIACTGGAVTGLNCGAVLAVGTTHRFLDGSLVGNLTETNACTASGDSGSPVFIGSTAVGLHSGSNFCDPAGPVTVFQPLAEVLATYGLFLAP